MDHLEMVEKLRAKANVSYEEARDALEACDWDLLDALLMLESEGRLNEEKPRAERKKHGEGVISQLMRGLGRFIRKCNAVTVQIKKGGETRMELSMTVVILLVAFMFWWVIAAALIAMIFGYRYSVKGLRIDDDVNQAMDKAGDFVNNVVNVTPVKVVHEDEHKDTDSDENK